MMERLFSFDPFETYALKMIVYATCFCIFESAIGALKQPETLRIMPLWGMSFSISAKNEQNLNEKRSDEKKCTPFGSFYNELILSIWTSRCRFHYN